MNKKHYDRFGDPLPQIKNALAIELQKMIPESRFREPYKKFCKLEGKYAFMGLAEDVLKACPENVTLDVDDAGVISFTREDVKRDNLAALTGDALAEYNKDQGPADLQELLKRGLDSSSYKTAFLE